MNWRDLLSERELALLDTCELVSKMAKMLDECSLNEARPVDMDISYQANVVVEAIWELYNLQSEETRMMGRDGREYLWMADIRKKANEITGSSSGLTPGQIGVILRNILKLEVGKRHGAGIPVYWDQETMEMLKARIEEDNS